MSAVVKPATERGTIPFEFLGGEIATRFITETGSLMFLFPAANPQACALSLDCMTYPQCTGPGDTNCPTTPAGSLNSCCYCSGNMCPEPPPPDPAGPTPGADPSSGPAPGPQSGNY